MKKETKALGLKKETVSTFEDEITADVAKSKGKKCKTKTVKPIPQMPQDPRPDTGASRCIKCGTWL
ncbi:hypothetical protein [Kordia antarctica]|nr:hypothetical protein [Kordia antarctica]